MTDRTANMLLAIFKVVAEAGIFAMLMWHLANWKSYTF